MTELLNYLVVLKSASQPACFRQLKLHRGRIHTCEQNKQSSDKGFRYPENLSRQCIITKEEISVMDHTVFIGFIFLKYLHLSVCYPEKNILII